VLYELLTGKRLFEGEDAGHTLAAVIMQKPDLSAAPAQVLPLLQRCLEKDPRKRLRDIGDVELLLAGAPAASATQMPRIGGIADSKVAWGVAGLLALIALGVSLAPFREKAPANPSWNLSIAIPGDTLPAFLGLSPDGRSLAVVIINDGKGQIWLRSLDSPQLQLLPGTENVRGVFWSPDSKSIGFFADGKLKTVPASGGPSQVLCDGTGSSSGGTWNSEGVILFSSDGIGAPLKRVNAIGGACTAVTKPEGESNHGYPEFLPDGEHFVYTVHGGDEAKRGLYVATLDNPSPRRLLADESSAIFAPSTAGKKYGYLLFRRGKGLMAQPFNAETLQLAGDVFPVVPEVSLSINLQIAASASASGILVYETGFNIASSQLTWMDRSGKDVAKVGSVQDERLVSLSPDERAVATMRPLNQGIWLYDLQRGGETRFTSPAVPGIAPVWSPDGSQIVFGDGKGLYLKDAGGGSSEQLLFQNGNEKTPSDWSRDGRYLIYTETNPKTQADIWYLPDPLNKSGDRKPVLFQETNAVESQGQLSPDGRWLAYVSDESGSFEVYVRPFPAGPGRWKVSSSARTNREPRWSRDGKELFFLEARIPIIRLMAVPVQFGSHGDFQAGAPQPLFEFRALTVVPQTNSFLYSPSADGKRFLVYVQPGNDVPTVNVNTNWEKAALGNK